MLIKIACHPWEATLISCVFISRLFLYLILCV